MEMLKIRDSRIRAIEASSYRCDAISGREAVVSTSNFVNHDGQLCSGAQSGDGRRRSLDPIVRF